MMGRGAALGGENGGQCENPLKNRCGEGDGTVEGVDHIETHIIVHGPHSVSVMEIPHDIKILMETFGNVIG